MRLNYFILSLVLFPMYALGQAHEPSDTMLFIENPTEKNTLVKSFSNESAGLNPDTPTRSTDFPTQIIRMTNPIENRQVDCDQVNDEIDRVILDKIISDKFTYSVYISCSYDPDTHYATKFTINSYFDPLTDEAIDILKSYLDEFNGSELLGAKLNIESAKALVVSLSITAGTKKNPNNPPFIVFREDRSNFYFKSNYDLRNKLFTDMQQNFFSNEPDKVLPFFDKWLFAYAGELYKAVLRDSNYVLLQPERIFLMDSGEEIFVSRLKYYFAHNCNKYENHRCLKQES